MVMALDPATGGVNRYLWSLDVSNAFIIGPSNFPQNAFYNPIDTVDALPSRLGPAEALVNRCLKTPGPPMPAGSI